jgi:pyruvate kinase
MPAAARDFPCEMPLPEETSNALDATGQVPSKRLLAVLAALTRIRSDLVQLERQLGDVVEGSHASYRASARNLVHYLALRRHDIRALQEDLAEMGLSSLGRTESHVGGGIDAVLAILRALAQVGDSPRTDDDRPALDYRAGKELLLAHTESLLGVSPSSRSVRIMVTMPSEAASDYGLVRSLVAGGMDCMRINCAHDNARSWKAMLTHLERATREVGKPCRVLMDLPGPKLRTGPLDATGQVVKLRPVRDDWGRVHQQARVLLTPNEDAIETVGDVDACFQIPSVWLDALAPNDRIRFADSRGKTRVLVVGDRDGNGRRATCDGTAYLFAGTELQASWRRSADGETTEARLKVGAPPVAERFLLLKPGDLLRLTAAPGGQPARHDEQGRMITPASISVTLPSVLDDVRSGQPVWFDDGKMGGTVESVDSGGVLVRIVSARPTGERLRSDKGINLPATDLRLPLLSARDLEDLAFIAEHADLVGLSFVRSPEDVLTLQAELEKLGAEHLGIVLKIETRAAFEQLPRILLAAMRGPLVGVMIARGDLAIECGYERLAEIQEEILWFCEAAHVPVIWATQVLENLAKTGMPSRAEITDAAMGERAECVMLNKGPYLVEAVRTLDDILRRMEAHQSKKTPRLRSLRLSQLIGGEGA